MFNEFNHLILSQASKLNYSVSSLAPNSEVDLFNSGSLVIWNGASDNTIWHDAKVNYAFRALHDALHLESRLGFSVPEEIELGRIQANKYSGMLSDLIYTEVALQAKHFQVTGNFVSDQVSFTLSNLKAMGYKF